NDFLFAYAKVKVNKGTFGLYSEIAAKGGSFKGYSKPIIKDIEIDRSAQEDKTLLQKLWAGVVAGAAWVLTNSEKDQVATKIPIEGKFNQPSVDIWSTIGSLLKNAFIQALSPSFEEAVHISDVPGGKAVADEKTAEKKKEKKEEKDKIKKEEDKKEDKKDGKKKKKHFWQRRSA
ncbi:MAG TPA: hypothetical protein VGO45_06935, partial [Bacteroidia bacterium]|nr:hypothetical protein [Bacteroidia bacterium]